MRSSTTFRVLAPLLLGAALAAACVWALRRAQGDRLLAPHDPDEADEASRQSFPASDAPASMASLTPGAPR